VVVHAFQALEDALAATPLDKERVIRLLHRATGPPS
jgi:hypothetical protein